MEIKRTIKEVAPEYVYSYIAFDGKEFDNKWRCWKYESNLLLKKIFDHSQVCIEAEDNIPFNGKSYSDLRNCYWIKPLDYDAISYINLMIDNELCKRTVKDIENWICLEISDDDQCCYVETLDSCIDYVKKMFGYFGMAEITKKINT